MYVNAKRAVFGISVSAPKAPDFSDFIYLDFGGGPRGHKDKEEEKKRKMWCMWCIG
jgi:hypothetical protein